MPRFLLIIWCLALTWSSAPGAEAPDAPDAPETPEPHAGTGLDVMVDVGLAMPLGDLGAGLPHSPTGLGAEKGYRLGLRTRWTWDNGMFLSPAFTYTEFGDHDGYDDQSGKTEGQGQEFKVRAATLRYGIDVGYLAPGPAKRWRAGAAFGVAAVQQRYHEELIGDEAVYEASLYDAAWLASVLLRRGSTELALEYHGSRFTTSRFLRTPGPADYDWSYAALRVTFALPR